MSPAKTLDASNSPALVVLAAGMGSRYGGLKQVEPVGPSGELIIDYSIHDALDAGFRKVVFVIRKDIEKAFRAAIGSRYERRCDVAYVFQELDALPAGFSVPGERVKPWGTGHATLVAKDAVPGAFGVINADDFYGRRGFRALGEFLADSSPDSATFALVGFKLRNTLSEHGTVSRGLCDISAGGFLNSITELTKIGAEDKRIVSVDESGSRTELSGDELVSMNMWGFSPLFFQAAAGQFEAFLRKSGQTLKAEFFLPAIVDRMIRQKQAEVRVLSSVDQWYGVTNREDKPRVVAGIRSLVEKGVYTSPLFQP